MAGTITICTASTLGHPRTELAAARTVLAANSKVFADMLSLPTKAGASSSIDITETMSEFEPFLRLLNICHDRGDPLEQLRLEDWPVVSQLADKYDSASVRGFALGMCWKWKCGGLDEEQLAAFQTAAHLRQSSFAAHFMLRILCAGDTVSISAAVNGRQADFTAWIDSLKVHALSRIILPPPVSQCDTCAQDHDHNLAKLLWYRALHQAMQEWASETAGDPFVEVAERVSGESDLCEACQTAFDEKVAKFEEEYRDTAPGFPV
ncbi:hypothetical protein JCM9279_002939 [Rhodotorula babjevae]